ncbi:unnamed protein product [Diamesa serratosioi]
MLTQTGQKTLKLNTPWKIVNKSDNRNNNVVSQVGNTTVKKVCQVVSHVPSSSSSSSTELNEPKLSTNDADYVKDLEAENYRLRQLLLEVRKESFEVQMKVVKMQKTIETALLLKKKLPLSKTIFPKIPSFCITDIDIFLKFNTDLAHAMFYEIVLKRIYVTCNIFERTFNFLNKCLCVIISKDILKHFKWVSMRKEYHSLSKFENFIKLFHNVILELTNASMKYSRRTIEAFLRTELMAESQKATRKNMIYLSKFPNSTVDNNNVVRKLPMTTANIDNNEKLVNKILKSFVVNPSSSSIAESIGIDEDDLQSEEMITENVLDETTGLMKSEHDDNKLVNSRIDDEYEKHEIDPNQNFDFDDKETTDCGFEIVDY